MDLTSLLVCSDDRALRVLRSVLGELEIDVKHCSDPRSAAKELARSSFGAVIIDCKDDNSLALLRSLRSGPHNTKSMAVAIIEARTNLQEAFSLGANFVVFKPISTEKVKSSFRAARALMRRERRRSVRMPVKIDAYFRFANGDGEQSVISSLSEGGMAVRFGGSPGKKTGAVGFSFALPDTTTVIEASGTIAWQDARNHVGIQFGALPETAQQSLKEWLRLQSGEKHDPPIRCALVALSPGGCFLRTPSPFPAQSRVELLLRAADRSVKTQGKVQFMDPELGMGVEFQPRTEEERHRLEGLIQQITAAPGNVSEVLVEPEGMDWEDNASSESGTAPAEEASDALLGLFRRASAFGKAEFVAELEKYRLAAPSPEGEEANPIEPFAYQRREPRLAVTLPVEVTAQDHEAASQGAHYIDVSHRGARVGGVALHLKAGEVVNLTSDGCDARFLVIWVGEPGTPQEGQLGLQSLANE